MAALLKSKSKKTGKPLWTVQVNELRGRPTIPLGSLNKQEATEIKGHIERLARARQSNANIGKATAAWLADMDDDRFYARLVKHGLCEPRQLAEPTPQPDVPTLAAFIDGYIAKRTDAKPA